MTALKNGVKNNGLSEQLKKDRKYKLAVFLCGYFLFSVD